MWWLSGATAGRPEHSSLRRADRFSDLRRHLPGRQSGREGASLPARHLYRGAGRRAISAFYSSTVGETIGCTLQAEIRSPAGSRALYSGELSLPIVGTLNGVHPWSVEHPFLYTLTVRLIRPRHQRPARPGAGRKEHPVRLPHHPVRGRGLLSERPAGGAAGPEPASELRLSAMPCRTAFNSWMPNC